MNYTLNLLIMYSLNHVYGKKSHLISLNLPPRKCSVNGTSKYLASTEQRIQAIMWVEMERFLLIFIQMPRDDFLLPSFPGLDALIPFYDLCTARDKYKGVQKLDDMPPIVHFEPL